MSFIGVENGMLSSFVQGEGRPTEMWKKFRHKPTVFGTKKVCHLTFLFFKSKYFYTCLVNHRKLFIMTVFKTVTMQRKKSTHSHGSSTKSLQKTRLNEKESRTSSLYLLKSDTKINEISLNLCV